MYKTYKIVREEIRQYGNDIYEKPEIIILNKRDLFEEEEIQEKINDFSAKVEKKVLVISAEENIGIDEFKDEITKFISNEKREEIKKEKWLP